MKKVILSSMLGLVSIGSAYAECTYSLDATLTDIKNWQTSNNTVPNFSRTYELIQNINQTDQKANGPINFYANTSVDHFATSKKVANFRAQYRYITNIPSNVPMVDTAVSSTGIVALESVIDVANLNINMGASTDSYEFGYNLTGSSSQKTELGLDIVYGKYNNSPGQANGDYIYVTGGSFKPNGTGFTTVKEFDRKTHQITVPIDGKTRVGVYVNQSTKQVGYIINGVNYGYLNITLQNAINTIGYSAVINQEPYSNSLLVGKNVSLQLITDHSKMLLTYPSAAKDICGTAL
ncbi:DUF4882 family protein [Acinetobacter beijerinckii]|jgi:hypothetical protein|uniref:DUF4882 family protein n=1 Tax=Acinetobacter TaxID=469 RepID=UPI0020C85AEA|nr:DUF4882 family protein [Acinetobacter sp. Z1]UTO18445.1 DUF4882 domain-containing protein [Acinetobacter sp. Z1]